MAQAKIEYPPPANDALPIFSEDDEILKAVFRNFEELMKPTTTGDETGVLVQKIGEELTVHSPVEEEIFYPRFARRLRTTT